MTGNHIEIFSEGLSGKNITICISGLSAMKPFQVFCSDVISDYEFVEKNQCLPLYRYDSAGNRQDNITDWGLGQFQKQYKDKKIGKEDIFHYVYAVLHHPAYRTKYELNLKREFPRIPFYTDFWQWAGWGKSLMELHIGYETAAPYPLEREDMSPLFRRSRNDKMREGAKALQSISELLGGSAPPSQQQYTVNKTKLKARKEDGVIEIDEVTHLLGIPAEAWEYRLGNRSALEWVLDQYKESKPKDPTIAAQFNTYRFADHKEHVITLLQRVCTVSVETMRIVGGMGLTSTLSFYSTLWFFDF